ncbi:MAG TPA: lipid-A-disaccharide synthase [Verrucomicrobiae bacterium]|nr:lipid-A-disaccharide synthase [Verrucomicrobiae bacterium]
MQSVSNHGSLVTNQSRRLMFVVGEASADAHAAELIKCLRTQAPGCQVFGAGGSKMKAAGMELLVDLTEHAVVGVVEPLRNYFNLKRIFNSLLAEAERRRPDALVLVDFSGFNLRFASAVKSRLPSTKIIYYISPQVWASRPGRARRIERDVDLMLCIFPFEKDWYAKHAPKLKVEFVGHPFAERIRESGVRSQKLDKLILLLPGSREREVKKIWPIMAKVVDLMPDDVRFVAAAVNRAMAAKMKHTRVTVEVGKAQELMQRATIAITKSGTATMECAFHGCPMVVVYKVNWLTYLVGRMVVTVNWLAMPNVIANRAVVPEFIQGDAKPDRVAAVVREFLENAAKREAMQKELASVVSDLGDPGASERAARLILAANER